MAKYLVIEPHADDAFLSLHATMKRWVDTGSEVFIYTEFWETAKRRHEGHDYAESIGAVYVLTGELDELLRSKVTLVCPIGIQHPEHVKTFEKYGGRAQLFYFDMPYALKLKNGVEIERDIKNTRIQSFIKPHANKWNSAKIFKSQAKFFHFNLEMLKGSFEMLVSR